MNGSLSRGDYNLHIAEGITFDLIYCPVGIQNYEQSADKVRGVY